MVFPYFFPLGNPKPAPCALAYGAGGSRPLGAEAGSALPIASDGRHFFGLLPRRYFGAALYTTTLRRPGIAFGHALFFFLRTVARLGSGRCYIARRGDSPFWLETAK